MTTDTDQPDFFSMRAQLLEVKDEFGSEEAKRIIKTVGLVERMADIKPERVNEVIAACKAKLNPEPDVLDQPWTVAVVENVVVPAESFFYACSTDMQDAAIQGLNNMPGGARTVEQAINAIYNAWVHAGFVKHDA